MNLDPASLGIVQAIFGMGLLTFAMFFWMSFARLVSMKRAGLTLADAQYTEDLRPRLKGAGRKAGDNYNHLFEAPVVFYAVALAILFAHAADPKLAMAVFAAVSRLERQLGLTLLDRSGYRVGATEAGHALLERAQTLLRETELLSAHARQLAMGVESELRVVLGDFCPRPPLLDILGQF